MKYFPLVLLLIALFSASAFSSPGISYYEKQTPSEPHDDIRSFESCKISKARSLLWSRGPTLAVKPGDEFNLRINGARKAVIVGKQLSIELLGIDADIRARLSLKRVNREIIKKVGAESFEFEGSSIQIKKIMHFSAENFEGKRCQTGGYVRMLVA